MLMTSPLVAILGALGTAAVLGLLVVLYREHREPFLAPNADHIGEVQAWDVDTGKKVWTHNYPNSMNWGPMLATAGGLVFSGGTNDRKIHAFDASNGKLLWESPVSSGILAPPTTFTVEGKQYIAVLSAWGGDSRGDQNTLNRLFPGDYPESSRRRRCVGVCAGLGVRSFLIVSVRMRFARLESMILRND